MSITVNKTRLPGSVIKTASGAVASVSDARMRGAIGVEASFSPKQDLHGYSNPWPSGGGVNKLPAMVDGTYEGNGVKAVVKDGVATFSGTTTARGNAFIIPLTEEVTASDSFYYHCLNSEANASLAPSVENSNDTSYLIAISLAPVNRISGNYTDRGGKTFNRIRFYIESGVTISGTYAPMFCADNTARSYQPYENICPITGHTSASAWADPQYAGLVDWNQLFPAAEDWYAESVQSRVVVDDDGVITATFMTGGPSLYAPAIRTATYPAVIANHIYYFACKFKPATDGYPYVRNNSGVTVDAFGGQTTPGGTWGNYERIVGATGDADLYYFGQGGNTSQIQIGDSISFKDLVCVDLTRVYGAGNEPLTVNEFRSRFPKDYYAYNPGEMMTISAVNGDPHNLTVQLGEERYGGSFDFVRGKLTLTMRMVDLGSLWWGTYSASYGKCYYATPSGSKNRFAGVCSSYRQNQVGYYNLANGEFCTNSGSGYSMFVRDDRYPNATGSDFKHAISGVQLCYELATPIVIDMTPAEFELFHKNNFVWSDVGDTTLTYAAIHEHGG